MADEKQNDAEKLSELLDSALKDFNDDGNSAKPKNTDDDLDDFMAAYDQQAAQKAAGDFQKMLEQMVQVQEEAMKRSETDQTAPEGEQFDPNDPESKMMMNAIKQLMECSSTVANAGSEEEFMKGLEMLRSPNSPMEPFMSMIMQTLASKEVMYPPLKEIYDNYPKYLEEHAAELDVETRTRYDKQLEVLGKICSEFENQPDIPVVDPQNASTQPTEAISTELTTEQDVPSQEMDETAAAHFERLGKLLVELQTYGYPPKELVGSLPDGWGIDESGLPKVQDPSTAAEACSIM